MPSNNPETIELELEVDVQDSVSAKEAEAWAVGKRGGVDVGSGDPTYHNNSKYYAQQASSAEASATAAAQSAAAAEASEENAEAWAKGTKDGEAVESTDPAYHNNAKYYAEQAGGSATAAGASETNAGTSEENAEAWAKGTKDGTAVESTDPAYHNNAKYYAEQAGGSATAAGNAQTAAETAQGKAEDAQDAAEDARDTAQAAAASASAAYGTDLLAPDYSNLTYPVLKGKICIYDGDVYEAKQDINESEAWTAAHWKQITIGGQIEHLDRAVITLEMLEKARSFTPAQIQEIAKDGTAADYFAPGDIIVIPWTDNTPATPVTYQYPFVVTHIGDVIDDQDAVHHNAIYLMAMYATPQTIQFDHPEAIIATEETFQADTYYYIKNGDDWVEQTVEVGAAIPSGTTY